MIRHFEIEGSVTGRGEGSVHLSGVFDWQFDARNERLLFYMVRDCSLSQDQYVDSNGVNFTFFYEIKDLTKRGNHETRVGYSRGMRDTAHLIVRLMCRHDDGQGLATTGLGTDTLREAGNLYYDPPLLS